MVFNFYFLHYFCLLLSYKTIIDVSLFFFACNQDLQTTTVLFTRNASSHENDWILTTTYCLLSLAFLCLTNILIRTLVVSPSSLLYRNLIFVYFVHIACCFVLAYMSILFVSYWCCWFTCNNFVIFVCVAFAHFNFKRYYTVFICVTINFFTFN